MSKPARRNPCARHPRTCLFALLTGVLLSGCLQAPLTHQQLLRPKAPKSVTELQLLCPKACLSAWTSAPMTALQALKSEVTEQLTKGQPGNAQQAILQGYAAVNYHMRVNPTEKLPKSAKTDTTESGAQTSTSTSTSTSTQKIEQAQPNPSKTPDWMAIKTQIHQLAEQIKSSTDQAQKRLNHEANLHRAHWLNTEVQRLQLQLNQGGFQPLVKLTLKRRQREAQTLLSDFLAQTLRHIRENNHQAAMKLAPKIALLSGEPEAGSAALTHHLLLQGFEPILADADLSEALSKTHHYFANAIEHSAIEITQTTANARLTPQHASVQKTKRPKRQARRKPLWKTLADALDKAMRDSDLPRIQQLVQQLGEQKNLPLEQRLRVEAMESFLQQQIQSLNTQADALYQQGQIHDAKALWQMLANLRPSDSQLQAKISRAEKVLDNLAALREQTSLTPPAPSTPLTTPTSSSPSGTPAEKTGATEADQPTP